MGGGGDEEERKVICNIRSILQIYNNNDYYIILY